MDFFSDKFRYINYIIIYTFFLYFIILVYFLRLRKKELRRLSIIREIYLQQNSNNNPNSPTRSASQSLEANESSQLNNSNSPLHHNSSLPVQGLSNSELVLEALTTVDVEVEVEVEVESIDIDNTIPSTELIPILADTDEYTVNQFQPSISCPNIDDVNSDANSNSYINSQNNNFNQTSSSSFSSSSSSNSSLPLIPFASLPYKVPNLPFSFTTPFTSISHDYFTKRPIILLLVRLFFFLYLFVKVIVLYSFFEPGSYKYFELWTILIISIYFFVSLCCSAFVCYVYIYKKRRNIKKKFVFAFPPRLFAVIAHSLFEVSGCLTCYFLFLLVFMNHRKKIPFVLFENLLMSFFFLLIEMFFNRLSVRIDQCPLSIFFFCLYLSFIWPFIYYNKMESFPYSYLNANKPICFFNYLLIFLFLIISYFLWYFIYNMKWYMKVFLRKKLTELRKSYKKRNNLGSDDTQETEQIDNFDEDPDEYFYDPYSQTHISSRHISKFPKEKVGLRSNASLPHQDNPQNHIVQHLNSQQSFYMNSQHPSQHLSQHLSHNLLQHPSQYASLLPPQLPSQQPLQNTIQYQSSLQQNPSMFSLPISNNFSVPIEVFPINQTNQVGLTIDPNYDEDSLQNAYDDAFSLFPSRCYNSVSASSPIIRRRGSPH